MPLPLERPATLAELAETNTSAIATSESINDRVRAFHKSVERVREDSERRFSNLQDKNVRKAAVDQEVKTATRKLRDRLDEDIASRLRKLGAARELLNAQRPFFNNPIQTLDRETLGDERRDRHTNTLSHAGAATLEQAAIRALRDDDVHLGAAIVARLHQLPTRDRPFHPNEIAERLQPAHIVNTRAAMAEASEAIDSAILSVQAISNPRLATRAKIARGVAALTKETE